MSELDELAAAVNQNQPVARKVNRAALKRPVAKHVVAPWKIWGGAVLGGIVAIVYAGQMGNKPPVAVPVVQPPAKQIWNQPPYRRPSSIFNQNVRREDIERDASYDFKSPSSSDSSSSPSYAAPSGGKTVHVSGYTTKSGKHVAGYNRSAPRR